ncbi:hypothetical protein FGO68_gene17745 [Halteria grandinella]|uniref:Uncharacterized protein n=1 Tax=Halteria grandinella TaxID=5974 RepID=A0A8J8NEE7_HALGN|nr:hypothetical protein FGO68_gene17745 [Halteria grandinella]
MDAKLSAIADEVLIDLNGLLVVHYEHDYIFCVLYECLLHLVKPNHQCARFCKICAASFLTLLAGGGSLSEGPPCKSLSTFVKV